MLPVNIILDLAGKYYPNIGNIEVNNVKKVTLKRIYLKVDPEHLRNVECPLWLFCKNTISSQTVKVKTEEGKIKERYFSNDMLCYFFPNQDNIVDITSTYNFIKPEQEFYVKDDKLKELREGRLYLSCLVET